MTRQVQEVVQGLASQQGAITSGIGARIETNSLVERNVVRPGLTDKTCFKQGSQLCKLVAGDKGERFKGRNSRQRRATIMPEASGVVRLAQPVCACLLRGTEAGIEAPSIVDKMPAETWLEAWRRLVQQALT